MTRKKKKEEGPMVSFSVRFPSEVAQRLDRVGERFGLDRSNLLRLIAAEKLTELEDRARKMEPGGGTNSDSRG